MKDGIEQKRMHWWDFWKHKVFWMTWLPVIVTFLLFVIGTALFVARRHWTLAYFQVDVLSQEPNQDCIISNDSQVHATYLMPQKSAEAVTAREAALSIPAL